jgi:ribonuclease HI
MAKSRVAPLKKLTFPQLELMAAVLGARLSSYLQAHLQASDVYLWSDSQIVLHLLSSKKERIEAIRPQPRYRNPVVHRKCLMELLSNWG